MSKSKGTQESYLTFADVDIQITSVGVRRSRGLQTPNDYISALTSKFTFNERGMPSSVKTAPQSAFGAGRADQTFVCRGCGALMENMFQRRTGVTEQCRWCAHCASIATRLIPEVWGKRHIEGYDSVIKWTLREFRWHAGMADELMSFPYGNVKFTPAQKRQGIWHGRIQVLCKQSEMSANGRVAEDRPVLFQELASRMHAHELVPSMRPELQHLSPYLRDRYVRMVRDKDRFHQSFEESSTGWERSEIHLASQRQTTQSIIDGSTPDVEDHKHAVKPGVSTANYMVQSREDSRRTQIEELTQLTMTGALLALPEVWYLEDTLRFDAIIVKFKEFDATGGIPASEAKSYQLVSKPGTDSSHVRIKMPNGMTVGLKDGKPIVCGPVFVSTGDKFVPVKGQERSYESYRNSDSGRYKPEDLETIKLFTEQLVDRGLRTSWRGNPEDAIADWLENIYLRVVVQGYMTLDFEIALLQIGRRILKRTVPQPSSQVAGLLESLDPYPGPGDPDKEDDNDDKG